MKLLVLLLPVCAFAQPTAFPSLRIPYHSRGLAMGDIGIAVADENQQLYYNAAKTAFTHHFHQVSVSYAPQNSSLTPDSRIMNVNYAGNTSNSSALGASLTYFDYGTMHITDNYGATLVSYQPREYSLGISYAMQVAPTASLGVTMRAIGQNVYTDVPRNLLSACGDVSFYQYIPLHDDSRRIEWGMAVYHLGPKVVMPGSNEKTPLPLTAGLGIGYRYVNESGDLFVAGVDVVKPSAGGLFRNWGTVRVSMGAEYGVQGSFFLRGGVSLEGAQSGNRKFLSLGAGYKGFVLDQSWGIDLHYLVPFGALAAVSPFQNAVGLTLRVNIGNFQ